MPAKLITTADDFGSCGPVNLAVERAHREGVLTSASLMVTGDAVDEAVRIARDNPDLAVGLHLALTKARSVLPPAAIPGLVDSGSRLPSSEVRASLRYYLCRQVRAQLRREIEAQFDAFAELGLPMSHVDGHQHMHCLVPVLREVARLAPAYGAKGIRVPVEPFLSSLRCDRSRPAFRLAMLVGLLHFRIAAATALRQSRLARCEAVIGSYMSGRMTDGYAMQMLSRVTAETVEVYFHPSEDDSGDSFGPNRGDLEALLSPDLREFVSARGIELTTYPGLARCAEVARERR